MYPQLAHVTESAKKSKRHHMGTSQSSSPKQNSIIWAPRKARVPKMKEAVKKSLRR